MNGRFDKIDERLDRMNGRFDKVDERFGRVDERFASIDVNFAELNGKLRLIYWMLGIIMASTTLPALHSLLGG